MVTMATTKYSLLDLASAQLTGAEEINVAALKNDKNNPN